MRDLMGDTWGFSSIAPIIPNRGFSVEILTGVWLCHKRLSWIGVSPS